MTALHADPDEIRTLFSRAMSEMYRAEVPQYGTFLELVSDVNRDILQRRSELCASLARNDELDRLSVERHGAIRVWARRRAVQYPSCLLRDGHACGRLL
ncbi:putative glyoxalase superfamily metalloenzyme YdcJ [Bradyrhizobium sp. LM2.7]